MGAPAGTPVGPGGGAENPLTAAAEAIAVGYARRRLAVGAGPAPGPRTGPGDGLMRAPAAGATRGVAPGETPGAPPPGGTEPARIAGDEAPMGGRGDEAANRSTGGRGDGLLPVPGGGMRATGGRGDVPAGATTEAPIRALIGGRTDDPAPARGAFAAAGGREPAGATPGGVT